MTSNNETLVPVVEAPENTARLNITWNGQNGDLPDPVPYDASDDNILTWATEALQQGIPGIDEDSQADLKDFVVDRFPAHGDIPFNRIICRPKTPFGIEGKLNEAK